MIGIMYCAIYWHEENSISVVKSTPPNTDVGNECKVKKGRRNSSWMW